MNITKLFFACLIASLLSACGTGEFFIKRGVNGLEKDVAREFKDYADFNNDQEAEIDAIAEQIDTWVRGDRLRRLSTELEKMAQDIERDAKISETTWASTVAFLERPMNLSKKGDIVKAIAAVAHSMSDEQAEEAAEKLRKDYESTVKEQEKTTLEKQNKKLIRGLKFVFADLGIKRSKPQLSTGKTMLAQRKSHIELDNQATEQDHNTFLGLIKNRDASKAQYTNQFSQAWETAERGAKHEAPELWDHNAKVAKDVLNYLLSDLDQEQRETASRNIRGYADLFRQLSAADG